MFGNSTEGTQRKTVKLKTGYCQENQVTAESERGRITRLLKGKICFSSLASLSAVWVLNAGKE